MGVLRVGILGAGVVGLTTALELQQEFPAADYTLIADKFTVDTTSDGAAGLFRPSSYFTAENLETTKRWLADAYEYYENIRTSGHGEASGIFQIGGYEFSNKGPVRCRLLEGIAPVYRPLTKDELDQFPEKWNHGAFMTTLIIENRFFQPWATNKFQLAGGKVIRRNVKSLHDLGTQYDVVMNCSGLGAKFLCDDYKLNPIRGQVIKVRAPWIKHFYMTEYDAYIIPNRDVVTLGGTRNYASFDLRVNQSDKKEIMAKCISLQPSLVKAEFVRDWVGLRPARDPVRVEVEKLRVGGNKVIPLVHNYGHGGYGITSAPGSAKHAVKLLKQALSSHNSFKAASKL